MNDSKEAVRDDDIDAVLMNDSKEAETADGDCIMVNPSIVSILVYDDYGPLKRFPKPVNFFFRCVQSSRKSLEYITFQIMH